MTVILDSQFLAKICELSPWSFKYRCFEKPLQPKVFRQGHFEALIPDLKMLTNYTMSVRVESDNNKPRARSQWPHRAPLIHTPTVMITTQGYTASVTRCSPESSEVTIHTGAFFGGKIAVEGVYDRACEVYGNRTSSQDSYVLKIRHSTCRSQKNNSRVQSTVIVHENRDIVTHNSRRFLVLCNLFPDTFTVQASINMPNNDRDDTNQNDIFSFDTNSHNHVRDSRILAEAGSARTLRHHDGRILSQFTFVLGATILAFSGCILAAWWYFQSSRRKDHTDIDPKGPYITLRKDFPRDFGPNSPEFYQLYGPPVTLMSMRTVSEI